MARLAGAPGGSGGAPEEYIVPHCAHWACDELPPPKNHGMVLKDHLFVHWESKRTLFYLSQ